MKNRIIKVMANVFNIDANIITYDSSPDNIETWDSLKHMNLIVALEEEFCVEFAIFGFVEKTITLLWEIR